MAADDVDLLRRAAARMRELAKAKPTNHRWVTSGGSITDGDDCLSDYVVEGGYDGGVWDPWAHHIASWDPVVALAVADWLDATADFAEHNTIGMVLADNGPGPLAVARAFLREDG